MPQSSAIRGLDAEASGCDGFLANAEWMLAAIVSLLFKTFTPDSLVVVAGFGGTILTSPIKEFHADSLKMEGNSCTTSFSAKITAVITRADSISFEVKGKDGTSFSIPANPNYVENSVTYCKGETGNLTKDSSYMVHLKYLYEGKYAYSDSVTFIAIGPPAKPIIFKSGNVLTSDYVEGNQWYMNDTLITGATQQSYTLPSTINYVHCYTVQQTNNYGCSSVSEKVCIDAMQAQPPAISSFSPTSGSLGTPVTITGKNFSGAASVSFGGTSASSFIVNNDSTITAVVGNGATGSVKIETPAGIDSLQTFTYTCDSVKDAKPIITSIGDSILVSSSASYYHWYFNNKKLENETFRLLNVAKAGFYHVETSSNNICWTASFDHVVLKNPNPLNDTLKMSIYPNPSSGNFTVNIKLPQTTTVTTYTTIYDVNGNKVLQTNKLIFFGNEIKVPVTLNTKGTFFVKVFVNGDSRQQTVIIQ